MSIDSVVVFLLGFLLDASLVLGVLLDWMGRGHRDCSED